MGKSLVVLSKEGASLNGFAYRGLDGGCARSRLLRINGIAIILWFFFACLNKPVVHGIL